MSRVTLCQVRLLFEYQAEAPTINKTLNRADPITAPGPSAAISANFLSSLARIARTSEIRDTDNSGAEDTKDVRAPVWSSDKLSLSLMT